MKALRKSLSGKAAIVGVAESDKIGKVPEISPWDIMLKLLITRLLMLD